MEEDNGGGQEPHMFVAVIKNLIWLWSLKEDRSGWDMRLEWIKQGWLITNLKVNQKTQSEMAGKCRE
jgi:hypothetical protein